MRRYIPARKPFVTPTVGWRSKRDALARTPEPQLLRTRRYRASSPHSRIARRPPRPLLQSQDSKARNRPTSQSARHARVKNWMLKAPSSARRHHWRHRGHLAQVSRSSATSSPSMSRRLRARGESHRARRRVSPARLRLAAQIQEANQKRSRKHRSPRRTWGIQILRWMSFLVSITYYLVYLLR